MEQRKKEKREKCAEEKCERENCVCMRGNDDDDEKER